MEKLPMCRVCLVQNVRMYLVVNRNFHELYEKLTDIPFVTEDKRPILACFFCCAKLKQCCRLLTKCLQAEELLAQMRNEDYEPNPLMNQDHLEFYGGFIKSPIENISIVDECQPESIAIKEELPAVCEGPDDIIVPKEEHQSDDFGAEVVMAAASSPFNLSSTEIGMNDKKIMKMEKLPMCRVCLEQNVRMYLVVNRNFHELYEKLTDIPFVTDDRRPILACFFCCAKLEKCCQLMRKCLQAEELFAQMMVEDYEPKPLMNQDHLEFYGGFIKSPIENISIVDVVQPESIAIKEELPAACEGPDDIIVPKEEHQCDELRAVADIAPYNSESDLEYDLPLIKFKTEVQEEQKVSKKEQKLRAVADIPPYNPNSDLEYDGLLIDFKTEVEEEQKVSKKEQRATSAKKPKLDTRRTKLEDAITADQSKNEKSDSRDIRATQNRRLKPGTYFKEPYKCDQRSFNRVKKITQHTRTQIGDKSYKCDVCLRSFRQKCDLTNHIRIHTGEKPYKCDVCLRSFSQKGHFTQHIRIHSGEKPYKCDACVRSFSQKALLKQHIRIHTGEKPYKCDVCLHSFSQKSYLKKHSLIHSGEKPYKCDVCLRSFSQRTNLANHSRIHSGEKPYKCDVCQRSFIQKAGLTNHIRKHTGEKPYKCDVCQSSFSEKAGLTQHIRIHSGEKPYKCDVCQRSFSEKAVLTQHIRTHTGEKRYKCDVCQRSFSHKGSLTIHTRLHTGEKPYKCHVCQCSFSQKTALTKHIRVHTGEKPYKCDVCHSSFSLKSNCTKHIRIHTGEKPYK